MVPSLCRSANKHKPWIETEYQGIVMENDNTVLLNPPLFALDKDAPLHYAGNTDSTNSMEEIGKSYSQLFKQAHRFACKSTELATEQNRSSELLEEPNWKSHQAKLKII